MSICYFCKEEKEEGKDLFWCPRLRSYDNGLTYYGAWVCIECCKDTFFKATYDKYTQTCHQGICPYCDFPIGAILYVNEDNDKPPNKMFIKKFLGKWVLDSGFFYNSPYDYYGFKWDHHLRKLILVRKPFIEGIHELVLKEKKLPTRILITLEDTFTHEPLSWNELNRYYWSSCGCGYEQYFDEEKWMDQAPVIICSGYLNQNGFNLDKKFKKKIENLKKKFGTKQEKKKK